MIILNFIFCICLLIFDILTLKGGDITVNGFLGWLTVVYPYIFFFVDLFSSRSNFAKIIKSAIWFFVWGSSVFFCSFMIMGIPWLVAGKPHLSFFIYLFMVVALINLIYAIVKLFKKLLK